VGKLIGFDSEAQIDNGENLWNGTSIVGHRGKDVF
jgi:hypothetical protein